MRIFPYNIYQLKQGLKSIRISVISVSGWILFTIFYIGCGYRFYTSVQGLHVSL